MFSKSTMVRMAIGMALTLPTNVAGADEPSRPDISLTQVAQTPIKADALALVKIINSRDAVMSQVTHSLDVSLPKSLRATDYGIMEKSYPGLIDAMVAAHRPIMLKAYVDKIPLLWQRTARLYTDSFTDSELAQLLKFYSSPVGQRLLKRIYGNIDNQAEMNAVMRGSSEAQVKQARAAMQSAVIRKTVTTLSDSDKLAIFRFEHSPAGRKLATINPKSQAIAAKWDREFPEETAKAAAKARDDAISDFIAKADAKKQEAQKAVPADSSK